LHKNKKRSRAEEMEMLRRNKKRSQGDGEVGFFIRTYLWVDGLAFEC